MCFVLSRQATSRIQNLYRSRLRFIVQGDSTMVDTSESLKRYFFSVKSKVSLPGLHPILFIASTSFHVHTSFQIKVGFLMWMFFNLFQWTCLLMYFIKKKKWESNHVFWTLWMYFRHPMFTDFTVLVLVPRTTNWWCKNSFYLLYYYDFK